MAIPLSTPTTDDAFKCAITHGNFEKVQCIERATERGCDGQIFANGGGRGEAGSRENRGFGAKTPLLRVFFDD